MSKPGMSDPAPGVVGTAPPQVSAAQWQSFEMRMRKRRAMRLMVRAQAALEQGRVDEAEAALEEAHTLDSSPEIAALSARLHAPVAPLEIAEPETLDSLQPAVEPVFEPAFEPVFEPALEPAFEPAFESVFEPVFEPVLEPVADPTLEPVARRRSRAWVAIPAALFVVAVLAIWDVTGPDARRDDQAAQPSPAPASVESVQPAPTAPPPEMPTPQPNTQPAAVFPEAQPAPTTGRGEGVPATPTASLPRPVPEAKPLDSRASFTAPPTSSKPASVEAAAPAVTLPEPLRVEAPRDLPVRDGVDLRVPPAPAPALPSAPPPSEVSVPVPTVSAPVVPVPERVDETPAVRRVLGQYEAAYSTLDVASAKRVWPSLDTLALARAFDGLEMQRISLGECRIAFNGPAAQADCRGSSEWKPKIGGGTRSGNRSWAFNLRKTDGQWRIVDAIVR